MADGWVEAVPILAALALGFIVVFLLVQRGQKKRLEAMTGHPASAPWPEGHRFRDMTAVGKTSIVVMLVAIVTGFVGPVLTGVDALFWVGLGSTMVAVASGLVSERRRVHRMGLDN